MDLRGSALVVISTCLASLALTFAGVPVASTVPDASAAAKRAGTSKRAPSSSGRKGQTCTTVRAKKGTKRTTRRVCKPTPKRAKKPVAQKPKPTPAGVSAPRPSAGAPAAPAPATAALPAAAAPLAPLPLAFPVAPLAVPSAPRAPTSIPSTPTTETDPVSDPAPVPPVSEPLEPSVDPPVEEPVEPSVDPPAEPVEPSVDPPAEPVEEPVEPSVDPPAEPVEEPVEPSVDPPAEPSEPVVPPAEPASTTPPAQPDPAPVTPVSEPAEPTEPPAHGNGGLFELPLFRSDYSSEGLAAWTAWQEPAGTERLSITDPPGTPTGPWRPAEDVMRVELRPGDRTTTSGYTAARAEVYGRTASPMSSTPAERWPDPTGAERWYAFSLYVPGDFPTAADTTWLTITQWKGLRGGSPPVALEVKRNKLRLGGTRTNTGWVPQDGDLGPLPVNGWTRIVVGMRLSPDSSTGWVEAYRDGVQRIGRTKLATMDTIGGKPDPVYVKQGIYRSTAWDAKRATHVLYFGPLSVGASRDAVAG